MTSKTTDAPRSRRRATVPSQAQVKPARKTGTTTRAASSEIRVLRHLRELYRVSQQHFQANRSTSTVRISPFFMHKSFIRMHGIQHVLE